MRVLITGAGGQLGTELQEVCTAAGDDVHAFDRGRLDVICRNDAHGAITTVRPDVVLHTGAWTAVDACEADPERAMAANGLAVRWIAEACARVGAHLVHVSTDYVFDGTLDRPYLEWDEPNPRSVYGSSKLAGEREALVLGPNATVVRTSWVCGAHGANMVKTIVRLAAERPSLEFVDDQIGCPTFTADLAPAMRRLGALDRRSGIVHVTNQRSTSWYGFATEVVTALGRDPAMVSPIATADMRPVRAARRPANSVLDNAVLRMGGLPPMRDFHDPLVETVRRLAG